MSTFEIARVAGCAGAWVKPFGLACLMLACGCGDSSVGASEDKRDSVSIRMARSGWALSVHEDGSGLLAYGSAGRPDSAPIPPGLFDYDAMKDAFYEANESSGSDAAPVLSIEYGGDVRTVYQGEPTEHIERAFDVALVAIRDSHRRTDRVLGLAERFPFFGSAEVSPTD